MKKLIAACTMAVVFAGACRKKEEQAAPPVVNNQGKVSLTFKNVVGTQPLTLQDVWYKTDHGDSMKIFEYMYYVTNIALHSDSGEFKEWESYYLINESKAASKSFTIDSIPSGTYNKISFLIGVDEKRNTQGAQTGALDPLNAMFWDWNTGYIMAKLEGMSPQSPLPSKVLSFHVAGFKMGTSVIRKVTLTLPQPIEVNAATTKNIHLKADVLEWFKTPNTIRFNQTYVIGSEGQAAMDMADNYSDMFSIDHIE